MYSRKDYKLIGLVRKVEPEFANCEVIDGKIVIGNFQAFDYQIFDFEGKLIEESSSYREMMYDSCKDLYFYDEGGSVKYRDEYDASGKFIGRTVFEEIGDDKIIEKSYYVNENGELKLGSHIVRDEKPDFEIPHEDIDIDEIANYDKNEKIIPNQHSVFSESNRRRTKTKSIFDNGYQIETIINRENGEFSHRIVEKYDLNRNYTEHFCYEPYDNLYLKDEYTYEFDDIGNWIKMTQFHWVIGWGEYKLVPLSVTRRKIEYFKN